MTGSVSSNFSSQTRLPRRRQRAARMKRWVLGRENMTRLEIMAATTAVIICASPLAVRADEGPAYDFRKSCKTYTQAYQGPGTAAPGANTVSACVADEQTARATLVTQWTQFA